MSRINFSLSWAEHEKSFITSGPGVGGSIPGFSSLSDLHMTIAVGGVLRPKSTNQPLYSVAGKQTIRTNIIDKINHLYHERKITSFAYF